jgi:hypothetical protein
MLPARPISVCPYEFMAEARQKNLRVDVLCLHSYGDITKPDAVGSLRLK